MAGKHRGMIDDFNFDSNLLIKGNPAADIAGDIVNDAGDEEDIDDVGMVDGDAQAIENDDVDAFSEDQE